MVKSNQLNKNIIKTNEYTQIERRIDVLIIATICIYVVLLYGLGIIIMCIKQNYVYYYIIGLILTHILIYKEFKK